MHQTLQAFDKEVLSIPCHYGGVGFPESKLIVDFNGPVHPKSHLAIVIQKQTENSFVGVITANPNLQNQSPEHRKAILARAWIDSMYSISQKCADRAIDLSRVEIAMMFSNLGKRPPWQDTFEFDLQMRAALRYLLVSNESLCELITDFGYTPESLKDLVQKDPNEGGVIFRKIVVAFSNLHSVNLRIVEDRFQELLLEPLHP